MSKSERLLRRYPELAGIRPGEIATIVADARQRAKLTRRGITVALARVALGLATYFYAILYLGGTMTLWIICVSSGVMAGHLAEYWMMNRTVRKMIRNQAILHCRKCGYSLVGNISGECSECGAVIGHCRGCGRNLNREVHRICPKCGVVAASAEVACDSSGGEFPSDKERKMDVVELRMPEAFMEGIRLSTWLVANGATVELNDDVCTLETELASIDLTSPAGGVLEWMIAEGTGLRRGPLIARIHCGDEGTG